MSTTAAADDALLQATVESAVKEPDEERRQAVIRDVKAQLGDRRGPVRFVDLLIKSGPHGDGFGQRPDGLNLDVLAQAPHGVDLGPLTPRIPELLHTPSGRIEPAPEPLLEAAHALLAEESSQPDEGQDIIAADSLALTLVGRRILQSNNTWMHNIPTLYKARADPPLWMHPKDAAVLGIINGVSVSVQKSCVSTGIAP